MDTSTWDELKGLETMLSELRCRRGLSTAKATGGHHAQAPQRGGAGRAAGACLLLLVLNQPAGPFPGTLSFPA